MNLLALIIKTILGVASAASLSGKMADNGSAKCKNCLVLITNEKNHAIVKEFFSDEGKFETNFSQLGTFQLKVIDLENSEVSAGQNFELTAENYKSDIEFSKAFSIGESLQALEAVSIDFSSAYNSLILDTPQNPESIVVEIPEKKSSHVVTVLLPLHTKNLQVRFNPENPSITSPAMVNLDLLDESKFKKVEFNDYNRCYGALVNVKNLQKPRSLVDYSAVTGGKPPVFLTVNGEILLLYENKVFNYGGIPQVNHIDFSDEAELFTSADTSPVILYPPKAKEQKKIYVVGGNTYSLRFEKTPGSKPGARWKEMSDPQQDKAYDQLFKTAFIDKRTNELRIISRQASEQLRAFSSEQSDMRSEAVESLRDIVKQCREIGYDQALNEDSNRYFWKDYIKQLSSILDQYPTAPAKELKPGSVAAL